jgi:hypothetical protein
MSKAARQICIVAAAALACPAQNLSQADLGQMPLEDLLNVKVSGSESIATGHPGIPRLFLAGGHAIGAQCLRDDHLALLNHP